MNSDMWTMWELPRILDLYNNEYIIYNVTDWKEEDASRVYNILSEYAEYDDSTIEKIVTNGKILIIRYVAHTPNCIHVFTRDTGTKITIPQDKNIEDFITMYLAEE